MTESKGDKAAADLDAIAELLARTRERIEAWRQAHGDGLNGVMPGVRWAIHAIEADLPNALPVLPWKR